MGLLCGYVDCLFFGGLDMRAYGWVLGLFCFVLLFISWVLTMCCTVDGVFMFVLFTLMSCICSNNDRCFFTWFLLLLLW